MNSGVRLYLSSGEVLLVNLSKLSRDTGIDATSLSKMFSRKRIPKYFNGRKIAEALGIGGEQLYEALEPKKPESPTPE